MAMAMLDYMKLILQKVSFDKRLFEKELRKAIATLVVDEVRLLKAWCYEKFGQTYTSILNNCFATVA
jgi:hypothetical protein